MEDDSGSDLDIDGREYGWSDDDSTLDTPFNSDGEEHLYATQDRELYEEEDEEERQARVQPAHQEYQRSPPYPSARSHFRCRSNQTPPPCIHGGSKWKKKVSGTLCVQTHNQTPQKAYSSDSNMQPLSNSLVSCRMFQRVPHSKKVVKT